jgi:hypothetical protein
VFKKVKKVIGLTLLVGTLITGGFFTTVQAASYAPDLWLKWNSTSDIWGLTSDQSNSERLWDIIEQYDGKATKDQVIKNKKYLYAKKYTISDYMWSTGINSNNVKDFPEVKYSSIYKKPNEINYYEQSDGTWRLDLKWNDVKKGTWCFAQVNFISKKDTAFNFSHTLISDQKYASYVGQFWPEMGTMQPFTAEIIDGYHKESTWRYPLYGAWINHSGLK